jgi:hypothetical protein
LNGFAVHQEYAALFDPCDFEAAVRQFCRVKYAECSKAKAVALAIGNLAVIRSVGEGIRVAAAYFAYAVVAFDGVS